METEEIDSTLDELENRLDRLRALYEQYFLGIEKIEPAVARKDVDRRFWVLRRTQIRNTARRFRLQVLVQRYNTFQQYWTRICREIENGTYARHLLKAQKNLGAEPKTWAAKKRLGLLRRGGVLEPNGAVVAANGASDSEAPLVALLPTAAASAEKAPANAPPARAATVTLRLDDLGPLDLDFDDEPMPLPTRSPLPASPARPPLPPKASPAPVAAAAVAAKPATPREAAVPLLAARPAFAASKPAPIVASPALGRAVAPPAPAVASPAPKPAPFVPSPGVAKPAAPPAPAAARPPATAPSTALSEERVKKLYAELVETKRKLNQTNTVSVDALAKSLRDTETKLRAAHAGRTIDFQIVVKDGKPVVKPVVRK